MIKRAWWRLRILWLQKVRGRSGRFDQFNDPRFVELCPRCLSPPGECQCPQPDQ